MRCIAGTRSVDAGDIGIVKSIGSYWVPPVD